MTLTGWSVALRSVCGTPGGTVALSPGPSVVHSPALHTSSDPSITYDDANGGPGRTVGARRSNRCSRIFSQDSTPGYLSRGLISAIRDGKVVSIVGFPTLGVVSKRSGCGSRRCSKRTSSPKHALANPTQKPLELILARNLLTNLSTPGFLGDERGALVFYNEAAGAMVGIPFEEVGRMDREEWGARIGPFDSAGEQLPPEDAPLMIALRERRPVHALIYIHSAAGETHYVEVSALPLTSDEDIIGVMGIFWPMPESS